MPSYFFYKENDEVCYFRKDFYVQHGQANEIKEVVVEDRQGWSLLHYDVGSSVTFIVFNVAGSRKETKPFGVGYLLGCGYNVIACQQDDNQYQELSYESFADVVCPLVEGKEVFLYGSSLGGYCSIYYAGAVNGHVIAAAPRNSAHPEVVKGKVSSKFSSNLVFKHLNIVENPVTRKSVHLFFDPMVDEDVFLLIGS